MHNGQYKEAKALLDKARDQVSGLETSHDKAAGLINIGLAYSDLRTNLTDAKDSLSLAAFQTFSEAAELWRKRWETAGARHTLGAISANCTMKNIGTRGFAGDPKSYLCSAANKCS